MKRILSMVALSLSLFATSAFAAFDGYVTGSVYLRAGPDSSYPRVARLHRGTSVVIEGCVDDWSWCDVSTRNDRGWLSANNLQHEYEGHRVLVPRYGVQIGIPIISFVFGSYWDDHYRSRSWYRDRDRFSRVTTRYYRPGGDSHDYSSRESHNRQAPVPSRQETVTSQPSYQARPSTTVAPERRTATQPTPERTVAQPRPPVERNAIPVERSTVQSQPTEHKPVMEEHRAAPRQANEPAQSKPITEHRAVTTAKAQPKEMPVQSKAAHEAGKDKGSDKGSDQGRGKDKGKDKDNDQGGG